MRVDNVLRNVSGWSSDTLKPPPPSLVDGIACHLGLTVVEAVALLTAAVEMVCSYPGQIDRRHIVPDFILKTSAVNAVENRYFGGE